MSTDDDYEPESQSSEDGEDPDSDWDAVSQTRHNSSKNEGVHRYLPAHRSGSMASLPKSLSVADHVQTDQQYLRRLETRGVAALYQERRKRRRVKERLAHGGFHELTHTIVALQSSSSEDGSDENDERIDRPTIDWGEAEWGYQDSLFRHFPLSRFSSMIGWAHYIKSSESCPLNHLLDVPNTPLPPSILKFIENQAVVTTIKPDRVTWKRRTFLAREPSLARRSLQHWEKKRRLHKHKKFWVYNSDDECYKWIKENWKSTASFDVTVPVPRGRTKELKTPIPLATSGQVALGMLIEEILTDSFIPLARHHVSRCRSIADPFHDWTLPADEAILASNHSSPLPSSQAVDGNNCPLVVENWCKSRGIDPFFVQSNMHIYSKLLPVAPTIRNDKSHQRSSLRDIKRQLSMQM